MTDAKRELVDKYAKKLHTSAAKHFKYIHTRCQIVGIKHVMSEPMDPEGW